MISDRTQSKLRCQPAAGHIGAEICDIDISEPLDDDTVSEIRHALLTHKVVFFRGQNLDHAAHVSFARRFGTPTHAHPHEDAPLADYPEIHTIDPARDSQKYGPGFREALRLRQASVLTGWHTDLTATVNPPMGSILRADVVPDFGGDTTWTNLQAAYEDMSPALRALADGLQAVHRFRTLAAPAGSQVTRGKNARPYLAQHPVVRVHPETARRSLFINPSFTSHIVGMSVIESRAILDLLFAQITRPEFTVRFRWGKGDVAFWDNRITAHLAPADLDHLDVRRRMYRVTLMGGRPAGVDGSESTLLAGGAAFGVLRSA